MQVQNTSKNWNGAAFVIVRFISSHMLFQIIQAFES